MPGFKIPIQDNCGEAITPFGPSHTEETARAHRFLLEVLEPLGQGDSGMLLYLEKCTRPSPEYDKILIHSAQDEIPRPGKTHWKDVEFTFYEKLSGQANGSLEDQCAKLIYDWHAKGMVLASNSLHLAPWDYMKNCQLQMLDGDGEPVWTYFIWDAWPIKVSPSDLDYSNTDISRISVTLAYAKATEKRKGGQ